MNPRDMPRLAAMAACAVGLMSFMSTGSAQVAGNCGNPFVNHFGPWDYRNAPRDALNNVETHHFQPLTEAGLRGVQTGPTPAGDISYVLNVFPNHHRALITMTRLAERLKTDRPPASQRTLHCWFDRATRFAPDDTVVRVLYAQFLTRNGQKDQARVQLQLASDAAKENAFSFFNIGLAFFELGDHDRALAAAHRALALGLSRPELVDRLKRVNKWVEPGAEAPLSSVSEPASAAPSTSPEAR